LTGAIELGFSDVIFSRVNNIIFLEFYNKSAFPPGKWLREPDFCKWHHAGLACLAIRDMSLGVWKGFVGTEASHSFYNKSLEDILKVPSMIDAFLEVYGGITTAGRLPARYKEDAKHLWWLGVETSHGGDFMPLLKLESTGSDMDKMLSNQTYKDFAFIRRETNKLASFVSRIK
jgi:hypothetical protein